MLQPVQQWMDKNDFLLRRLHSLSGVVPIGGFLVEHLLTNSMAWFGPEKFNEHVHWLHELPYLAALEIFTIFIPLAFHGIFGIYIARTGKSNVRAYGYADNWRYTLQRFTGYVAFVFIIYHLAHYRFAHWFGGTEYVGSADPFLITWQGFENSWLPATVVGLVYALGLAASVFHFSNGMATFCITWGITVGDAARKWVGAAFAGLGVVLFVWGMMSIYAFRTYVPTTNQENSGGEQHVAMRAADSHNQPEHKASP